MGVISRPGQRLTGCAAKRPGVNPAEPGDARAVETFGARGPNRNRRRVLAMPPDPCNPVCNGGDA